MIDVAVKLDAPAELTPNDDLSTDYIRHFSDKNVAKSYAKKFNSRIERLRHLCEVAAVKPLLKGKLLDCSVGTGRFIKHLDKVTDFYASDTSPAFIAYINRNYPFVETKLGDLRAPLDYASESFDSVFSMRTLFAIGPIGTALHEMERICKPGGVFIFDYPSTSKKKKLKPKSESGEINWKYLGEKQESPDVILDSMSNVTYEKLPLDMFLHFVKSSRKVVQNESTKQMSLWQIIKFIRRNFVTLFFNSKFNFLPDRFWVWYEGMSHKYHVLSFKPKQSRRCRRYLYVCRKQAAVKE
ncbi:MAG: class I SAM-dependent methyltransferase [Rickettsiales bacterium]|nr:class I SAM-dependent methyltransferase [Rickettsiales bacterium]